MRRTNPQPKKPAQRRAADEPARAPSTPKRDAASDAVDEPMSRRQRLLVTAGAVLFGLATLVYSGLEYGAPGVVLILTALSLIGVIAAFWNSVRTLIGENRLTSADAFAIGSPRVEEEQKRAVLRALKDLEFERSVGKISDEDYRNLVTRYRADAKRLLRMIDEESADARLRAEELVEARLAELGLSSSDEQPEDAQGDDAEDDDNDVEESSEQPAEARAARSEPPASEPAFSPSEGLDSNESAREQEATK
ncbi:MAG: hypothetical protein U0271_23535 [Polyangiaceae bacterium]